MAELFLQVKNSSYSTHLIILSGFFFYGKKFRSLESTDISELDKECYKLMTLVFCVLLS